MSGVKAVKPASKSSKLIGYGLVGAIVLFCVCGGLTSIFSSDEPAEPTGQTGPTAMPSATLLPGPTAIPTETPLPTQALAPPDALRALIATKLGESNRDIPRITSFFWSDEDKSIRVQWTINDNLTHNFIVTGIQIDAADMLEIISQSGLLPDYQSVQLIGTFALQDTFGNVSEDIVVNLTYQRATIDKINWDNFLSTNVFTIADDAFLHPVITNP